MREGIDWQQLLSIALAAGLTNNWLLFQFPGAGSFLTGSRKVETALHLGIAAVFMMTASSAACYGIDALVLSRFGLAYLRTAAFVLVIIALTRLTALVLRAALPALYAGLRGVLPLMSANCAVLGAALLNAQNKDSFFSSVVYGFSGGIGFLLAMVLLAGIRERLVFADYPKSFAGAPIVLAAAGLMALAFMGFSGLKIW